MSYSLPLRDALSIIRKETGEDHSCNRIQKQLRYMSRIPGTEEEAIQIFPGVECPKIRGRWKVDPEQLDAAMPTLKAEAANKQARDAERRVQTQRVTQDYANHVLHDGTQATTWGSYHSRGSFHCKFISYPDNGRWETMETWICSNCWQHAATEHNKPECHRCSDWSPCGNDCTLSRVYCVACGTELRMQ